jgi:hypothetical protein
MRLGRPTYGNVAGTLALLIAMSGTAYAAASVGSADVIDDSLRSVDLKNGAVKQVDLKPAERWHEVGNPGEPAFGQVVISGYVLSWFNQTFGGVHERAGFYRDPYGRVYLKGTVCAQWENNSSCSAVAGKDHSEFAIFRLPKGYRPGHKLVFSAMSANGSIRVDVSATGDVLTDLNVPAWLALDGISLRCAPSGQNGCP